MCIICTEEIYRTELSFLAKLNVSYCSNLTSQKLQEVLIQCKNLKILSCYNCISLTSLDLRNNINLTELYCYDCPSLISLDLRNNINLTTLWCFYCKSLTSLDLRNNINLTTLWCYYCKSLTSLDLRSSSGGVTSEGCVNLIHLMCNNCTSLTSLDLRSNINLTTLWCFSCTSLTSLDLRNNFKLDYKYINYCNCPWITQNEYFSSNLQRLIRIQKWYRRILIIKYMKSKQFIEWIYNPSNIGGKCHKLKLLKEFTSQICE